MTGDSNVTEGFVGEEVGAENASVGEEDVINEEQVFEDIEGESRQGDAEPEVDLQRHEL